MLNRHLVNREHSHCFVVVADANGWEVREEQDRLVVRAVHRDDWHRVERDRLLFDLKVRSLLVEGWREAA